jgi:group I intron endonuclease
MIVYLLTNIVNGKRYVGITSLTIEKRWKRHVKAALRDGKDTILYRAIKKYGPDKFRCEKLEEVDEDLVGTMEVKYISELNTFFARGCGYNMTKGGDGGCKGYIHTPETRKFLSELWKGRHHSEATKKKLSDQRRGKNNPNFGVTPTKETKIKMSRRTKGANNPRAKKFIVFYPDGRKEEINDRSGFCVENNLNYFSVCSSIRRNKPHKGFSFLLKV